MLYLVWWQGLDESAGRSPCGINPSCQCSDCHVLPAVLMFLWQLLGHVQVHAGCRAQLSQEARSRNPLQAESRLTHTHTEMINPLPWLLSILQSCHLTGSAFLPVFVLPRLVHLGCRLIHHWWATEKPLCYLLIHEQKQARWWGAFWLCCKLLGVTVSSTGHPFSTRAALGAMEWCRKEPGAAMKWGRGRPCHSGSASPIPEHSILKQLRKALLNTGILRGNMNVRIQHSSIRGSKE